MRRTFPTLAALLLLCHAAAGTTLVAIIAPDQIMVAADSQSTEIATDKALAAPANKIIEAGSIVCVTSGFAHAKGFDIGKIVSNAARTTYTVADAANVLEWRLRPTMLASLAAFKAEDRVLFDRKMQSKPVNNVWFVGAEQGRPVLYSVNVTVSEWNTTIGLDVNTRRYAADAEHPLVSLMSGTGATGASGALPRLDVTHAADSRYLATCAALAVQGGINDPHGFSGGAIDIMQVTPNGNHWIQHK